MNVADPIAWEGIEDAIHLWVKASTAIPGDRVRVQATRDQGEARGPAPKAVISLVSVVELGQQGRSQQQRVMQQRYTVIAVGPGEVGVDFFDGNAETPQRISIVAGAGDPPATSATALLAQLTSDLPAGYTASADPMDTAAVLVDGTEAEPLFAASPADPVLLSVVDVIPRIVVILKIEHNAVWRVSFRSDAVSGTTLAANSMTQCMTMRGSYLDPHMRAFGFRAAGTALSTSAVDDTRRESTAVLDVRFRGWMTGAQASIATRRAGVTLAAA